MTEPEFPLPIFFTLCRMWFIRIFFAFLLFSVGFTCAEKNFGIVYGKVLKQYGIADKEFDMQDVNAKEKLYEQIYGARDFVLKQTDLPENVRYILSDPPLVPEIAKKWLDNPVSIFTPSQVRITKIQVEQYLDPEGLWVKVEKDSVLKLYSDEDTTRLTYNLKENRFYKFSPVAQIDSLPRVFRPHHFSRPVTEAELPTFPYKNLSEYTRFQQYIQLDTLDAPPLYSTALRMVQEKNYDSIPELLKISRQLREKYGKSPLGRDIDLALLANDTAYFKTVNPKEYWFGNISFGGANELGIAIEKALDTVRLEKALKNFPPNIQKNFRRNWERYQAKKSRAIQKANQSSF